jgi:hypothetical protein
MTTSHRALLLAGSLKREDSSSAALGEYLCECLRGQGMVTETFWLADVADRVARWDDCVRAVGRSQLVLLCFPVYADSLPAIVIEACTRIAAAAMPLKRCAAVTCAGNPEATHCRIAVAQCRRFCDACGWTWAGALAMGEGDTIAGRPLGSLGYLQRHTRRALRLAAVALAQGGSVPERARDAMARPVLPVWLYPWYAWVGQRRMAWQRGGARGLHARPFMEADRNGSNNA